MECLDSQLYIKRDIGKVQFVGMYTYNRNSIAFVFIETLVRLEGALWRLFRLSFFQGSPGYE